MTDKSPSLACKHDPDTKIGNQDCIPMTEIVPRDPIELVQLIATLDQRAYNLSLKGKFDEAVKDAQDIITSNKNSIQGYLRLGEIYRAQGKQRLAIETYDQGLLCVPSTDPCYALLVNEKDKATERSNKCVDFIADLPFELIQNILVDLPKGSKAACLHVSNVWRSKVLNCELVWAVITVEDTIFDNCFVAVLPHIAAHVQNLTMDSSNSHIWFGFMRHMQNGAFTKIKSLHLKGEEIPDVPTSSIYSQMKNTLTKLDLLDVHMPARFKIADILYTCPNLMRLGYQGRNYFRDILGDFVAFGTRQHPLRDLQINCYNTAEYIEPLLQHCQQLQRLVLNESTDSVLDVVYKTCQNLRIFAFNPNYEVTALEDLNVSDGRPGLREFYTISGNYGAPPQGVLPFLRRSMDTIRVIVANISLTKAQDLGGAPYFHPGDQAYNHLRFPDLQRLSYWSDPTTLFEPILLRSISTCTTLRSLTVVQMKIMAKVIDILMALPPLEELDMSFTWEEEPITEGLVRLFQYYARHAQTHNICLSHCRSVTDEVLDALGGIKSLRNLALWELSGASDDGLDRSLKKLSGAVTFLNLSNVHFAKDRHLATIGAMQGLKKLKLQMLHCITAAGVVTVIDTSKTLEHLIIAQCSQLTKVVYAIARAHVKTFEQNDVIDYD